MTTEEWLKSTGTTAESRDRFDTPAAREQISGPIDWLRLFLLRRRINAMLRSTVGPVRHEDAGKLPPHLMRDIGITPPM